MNKVIDVINERISLRSYDKREITKEDLDVIIDSAIKAPTAGNMMMYSIIKVTNQETKDTLSVTCDNQPFIKTAPVVLLFVCDLSKWYDYFRVCDVKDIKKPGLNDLMLGINDALIASQNTVIAAESLGIGSCYIGDIMENFEIHKELFDLPKHTFIASMLTLGYYKEDYNRVYRDRFDKEYIVFDEKYKRLSDDELKGMFKEREKTVPKVNKYDAKNFGQLIYNRKINSEFSSEMERSINKWIEDFIM